MTINCNDANVLFNFQPIQLLQSVTVPMKYKLKTCTIIDTDFYVQFMIKEGSSWCNITEWLPKKNGKWKMESERCVTSLSTHMVKSLQMRLSELKDSFVIVH